MGDEKDLLNQKEVEKILQQTPSGAPGQQPAESDPPARPAPEPDADRQIEALFSQGPPGAQPAAAKPAAAAQVETDSSAEDPLKPLPQEEVEKLFSQVSKTPPAPPKPPARDKGPATFLPGEGEVPRDDLEFLLSQAQRALASIEGHRRPEPPPGITAFQLPELSGAPPSSETATLDLLRDVELDLRIELGRTHMYLEDVLKLRRGSVVPLDKLAGDPVDIFVNGRLIARGEVLVLNDNFCVRVAELIAGTSPAG
ncbi:MAG: flagellar motor switch protein FliN [Thermoguttaceae bacterium]